jgi:heat-inducible transcriptional repressor
MTRDDLRQRKDKIFEIIVDCYVQTAEPVGSRTLSKRYDLGLSSASIRNVMADLEEEGLLTQPHTSAGRVPTDKGYRYYVDSLMKREELSDDEKARILDELDRAKTIDALAERVSRLLSGLTDNAALLYIKSLKKVSFLTQLLAELIEERRIQEFLEEEPELFIEGAFRMLDQPEFRDREKMMAVLRAFEEKYGFLQVLARDLQRQGIHVHIGRENSEWKLDDVSIVVKDWYAGELPIGGIAVVGPTRMRYSKVVSLVDFVADTVTDAVRRF